MSTYSIFQYHLLFSAVSTNMLLMFLITLEGITYPVKQFSMQLITATPLQKIPHPSLNTKFFAFLLNVTLLGKKEFKAQRHIIFA